MPRHLAGAHCAVHPLHEVAEDPDVLHNLHNLQRVWCEENGLTEVINYRVSWKAFFILSWVLLKKFNSQAPAQCSRAESMPKAATLQIAQPIWTERSLFCLPFFLMSQKDLCASGRQYRIAVCEHSDVASKGRCPLQELLFIPWIYSEVPDLPLWLRTSYSRIKDVKGFMRGIKPNLQKLAASKGRLT